MIVFYHQKTQIKSDAFCTPLALFNTALAM